ncbi:dTDP-4-dehydrorhamnose reductase [Desulfitobacterium dichloroeliminans LMG P-21439]|uniref:dTDP-4-dehydrorhamnose reductase n=1 Tax=Desulfitobacterium dichloroeliminans (strain LMG P-21439 / DCA1) TaxID=871963 RepID=L0F7P9_DESDL|nr:dTDP-4-dehydrorhamnose reductase [Desulfitobacterium dichloroeliminans]AGA68978.1 dTDP-4-dehydrorhamnose reductase [Desulfitobacterium dichloroeliminans LMG P-21439]
MKVIVCGAGGMLATDVSAIFSQRGHQVTNLRSEDLDITKLEAVRAKLKALQPDLVFNAAAYTNVDECESKPDLAYQVNCLGIRNLAIIANELNAALVHISTDYVFGGQGNKPYREYDPVNPRSVYGKSKLDGELMVRQHCRRHYIVRTAWLFGYYGNNFVRTMLRLAKEQEYLRVVNDQRGSPTYTRDLAKAIADLVDKPTYGTYHLTNSGNCTWYTYTQEIMELAGMNNVKVEPITTQQLSRPAERPSYSVLDNYVWRLDGHQALRPYREALLDYLEEEGLSRRGD